MRVNVTAKNFDLSVPLRRYAESKLWLAVQRATSSLAWAGVRLAREAGERGAGRFVCQVDLWLRRTGVVTVRHTDETAEQAIDGAAVRLEQALHRKLEAAAAMSADAAWATEPAVDDEPQPGVCVVPAQAGPLTVA